jgi:hypothetical protein
MQWIQAMLDCQKPIYHDTNPHLMAIHSSSAASKQNLKKGFTPSIVQTS